MTVVVQRVSVTSHCPAGHVRCIDLLVEHKAYVGQSDEEGHTALMQAAEGGHKACVEALIKKGADVGRGNKRGWTAMMRAALFGHDNCIKALLATEHPADVGQVHVALLLHQGTPGGGGCTTSTSSIRQLLGAADRQTAHHATFSTAPTHQPLGSATAETTPARAPAAAADRTQRPDATCEGKNG